LGDCQSPVWSITLALVTLYVPSTSGNGSASNVKLFKPGLNDKRLVKTVVTLKVYFVWLAGN
jgi:hypothetical protein